MTLGGEIMLRSKEIFLMSPGGERRWRNRRAENLACMIAFHRVTRNAVVKQVILGDIIPDIGWPRWSWLKPAVREELAEWRAALERLRQNGRGNQ